MSLCERLIETFPPNVNKNGSNFCKFIANQHSREDREKAGNIHEQSYYYGAIEHALYEAEQYCNAYSAVKDVYQFEDVLFSKVKKYFCPKDIQYYANETLKLRLPAMFNRGDMTKWGSAQNIINVFKLLFPENDIYCLVNTNEDEENLIENGSFEDNPEEQTEWTLSGATIRQNEGYSYEGQYGCVFNQYGLIEQTISVNPNYIHYFHLFVKGAFSIKIGNSTSNKYWNVSTNSWQTGEVYNDLTVTTKYTPVTIQTGKTDLSSLTITIKNIGTDGGLVDYVRAFQSLGYPEFEILIHAKGSRGTNVFTVMGETQFTTIPELLPGVYGPTKTGDKENKAVDNSYYLGNTTASTMEFMNFILDYLKPAGIQARLNVVIEDTEVSANDAYIQGNTLYTPDSYGNVTDTTFNNNQSVTDNTFNV